MAGKPLIVWTIEAGLKSNFIDKLIVSCDDKDILNISQETGVVIIVRPEELATDEASTFSVIFHLVKRIKEDYDFTVLLQPTSPLRNENHINEAFKLLLEKKADAVISVCKTSHNPLWSNVLPEDGSMVHFMKDEIKGVRSQDLPTYYRLNGAIYICRTDRLINEKTFFIRDNIYAYEMERKHSIDIDKKIDLIFAEIIYNLSLT